MDLTDRIIFEIMGLFLFSMFIFAGIINILQAPLFNWNVPLGYVGLVMSIITFFVLIILFCRDIILYIKAEKRISIIKELKKEVKEKMDELKSGNRINQKR